MPKELTIEVEPDSELAHAFKDADVSNITIVSDGERYRLIREDAMDWDVSRIREHFARFSGFLTERESEEIKDMIYHAREAGSEHHFAE